MSSPPASSPKLSSLEAVRAIAAVLVVLMHATHLMRVPQFSGHVGLGGLFDFGYVGVDVFFVLSGFLITYVHHGELGGGVTHWREFLWKRFVRIFPIYWLVLALSVLPSLLSRLASGRRPLIDMGLDALPGTLLLWIGGGLPEIVGVAWSLQFEILFYLSFCVLLLHVGLGLTLYAAWAALSVAQAYGVLHSPLPLSLGDPMCLEFLLGVAAGLIARRAPLFTLPGQGLLVAAALVAAVVYERIGPQGTHAFGGRIALGLAVAALILTLVAWERRRPARLPRPLAALGATSYSLYLSHCLLINIALAALAKVGLYRLLPESVLFLVAMTVALVGGWALGRWVELPVVAWLRRQYRARVPGHTAPQGAAAA